MIIGITGKSNSGKNVISEILKSMNYIVWDLDIMSKEIRENKNKEIKTIFRTTDPKEIAKIVFSDTLKLKELENIIYPELYDKVKKYKKYENKDLIINGALLYRAELDKLCDYIIYVDASFDTRIARGCKRDKISTKDFLLREKMQYDIDYRDVKYNCPVYVIENEDEKNGKINIQELKNKIRIIINSAIPI